MRWLRNPWVIGGIAMLVLALIIWFVGPLLGFGDARPLSGTIARIVTIVIVVGIWAGIVAFRQIRKKKAADQISAGIVEVNEADEAAASDAARSAEEVEVLRERFDEAVTVLRKDGGKKGAKSLYDLPWYIIIGPPGSGKTTALVNSGLRFPLADRFGTEALRGVGGTRNCDWWFTDEAILLDTAGRYTTQDSDASVDKRAWDGFLELLKKYRKRRPINGVLVAISALDLMTLDERARDAHARAIKTRIHELDEFFGIRFPVYVLVTKCDLVSGFVDYFEDLSREEREQVWGTTFPLDDADREGRTALGAGPEIDALLERLNGRLLNRLEEERDVDRRGRIYGFPSQVASLKPVLERFLQDVFRGSRFEQAPLLRGVYFTSGTQEGTPIDRVMGTIARTFGLDQSALPMFSGQGRSYFITRLLRAVVFEESEIAGTNQKAERRRAWLQRIAYGGAFVLLVALVFGWTVSYFNNQTLVASADEQSRAAAADLTAMSGRDHAPEVTLGALDRLRALARIDEDPPAFAGLGLFQGDNVAEQARAAYRRALVNQLLPRVMLRLEQQIELPDVPNDYTYEALKTYLRFASDKRYDAEAISAWVGLDWDGRLPRLLGTESYQQLKDHLESLLELRPAQLPMPMDQNLIARTRQMLLKVPLEERIYTRLKGLGMAAGFGSFNILEEGGPDAMRVFVRKSGKPLHEGVSPFFTRKGYKLVFSDTDSYKLVKDLSSEQWVLRDDEDLDSTVEIPKLIESLRELYFADYAREYESLLLDLEIAPFADAQEAAAILNILSREGDSPLELLIAAVKRETSFGADAPEEESDAGGIGAAVSGEKARLQQLLGARTPGIIRRGVRYANVVEQRFEPFHKMAPSEAGGTAPITYLMTLLRELADCMMTVAAAEGAGGSVESHVLDRCRSTLQRVNFEAERQSLPLVKGILLNASRGVESIASGGVQANIEAHWASGPLEFCQRAVAGRYPVDRRSELEIRLEDFGQFFGYAGELEQFFDAYVEKHVDTSRRPWQPDANSPIRVTADAIVQFERAAAVRQTFFRGDMSAYVGFDLVPVSMDPSISQFTLTLNDRVTRYFHGPRIPDEFSWPGDAGTSEVRIEMSPGGMTPMRRESGPWSWFRVLDEARMRPGSRPEHFAVTFALGDRKAEYELIARSAYNPFNLRELGQFRCPERITE